jgi:hypothetical protein
LGVRTMTTALGTRSCAARADTDCSIAVASMACSAGQLSELLPLHDTENSRLAARVRQVMLARIRLSTSLHWEEESMDASLRNK